MFEPSRDPKPKATLITPFTSLPQAREALSRLLANDAFLDIVVAELRGVGLITDA